MNLLLVPIILPLAATAICVALRRVSGLQRVVNFVAALGLAWTGWLLVTAVQEQGIQSVQLSGWAAPYGISLVADQLAATLIMLTGVVASMVVLFGFSDLTSGEEKHGHPIFVQALLTGVCGAFLAGDIFNLYVWFEVMLIASFGLLVVGGRKDQIDGAVKYVGLNLIATTAMLAGIGLLYGATGSLNMAALHLAVESNMDQPGILAAASLLLFAFAAKSAMFPLYFWLPAAYHTPSHTTSALFAALLTKVGVYTLIRVFSLVFDVQHPLLQVLLVTSGVATPSLGIFGAMNENHARRVLAYLVMVSIGIMTLGIAAGTTAAIAGTILYLMQTLIVTAALFMVVGCVAHLAKTEKLNRMGGLWRSYPIMGAMFVLIMLGVAGIPPTSGFWPKVLLVSALAEAGRWELVLAVVVGSLATLYAVMRLFSAAFWQATKTRRRAKVDIFRFTPIFILTVLVVGFGLNGQGLIDTARLSSVSIIEPSDYINQVLGERP